ncbi:MAG: response regulator [Gemmataceae bacterium]|nr:response regulator [Gemmataceae bacterium]
MAETILVVDDEEPVRRTIRDWLVESDLGCTVLTAGDAEAALKHAQAGPIDLAVLDWNLGTGTDGLQLLEDLAEFRPEIVAILCTGYAARATPLMALRKGVRDYLDKDQEFTRDKLLAAVRRQLAHIGPAKKHRELHETLAKFRADVEKLLPLVQTSSALTDPVPLPRAAAALCAFVRSETQAAEAVVVICIDGAMRAWNSAGESLPVSPTSFGTTLAGAAAGLGGPAVLDLTDPAAVAGLHLHDFERNRRSALVAPLAAGKALAAIELFDKPAPGFSADDRRRAAAAAGIGAELLAQALADRDAGQTLFDAVAGALKSAETPAGLAIHSPGADPATLELAEAIQDLAARYGPAAVAHCLESVRALTRLLDDVAGR